MWLGDPVTQPKAGGCIQGALASVKLCFSEGSFCLEGVRLFGLILWMCASQQTESRTWHIHQPPSVMAIQAPPPSQLRFQLSGRGVGRTAGVCCYHANSPCYPLKTRGSQLRCMREKCPKKVSFTALQLFIMLPYSVQLWVGMAMSSPHNGSSWGWCGRKRRCGGGRSWGTGRGASRRYVTLKAGQTSASCPTCGICISIDLCIVCVVALCIKRFSHFICAWMCILLSVYLLGPCFLFSSLRSFVLMWWCVLEGAGTH